jgi:hypothetical protein
MDGEKVLLLKHAHSGSHMYLHCLDMWCVPRRRLAGAVWIARGWGVPFQDTTRAGVLRDA